MSETAYFRDLYNEIMDYRRYALFYDVLTPWIERGRQAVAEFLPFQQATPHDNNNQAGFFARHNLYALNRVNDMLLWHLQLQQTDSSDGRLCLHEYKAFFTAIGFSAVSQESFSPFYHEIFQVHQSDQDNAPMEIVNQRWPALKLGDLLFSRSGVDIEAGRNHCVKEIAENATLYFTYRRRFRPTADMSNGWGANSQWRTDIRRDYETDGQWIYNFDGTDFLNSGTYSAWVETELTRQERIELCRNRCLVVTRKDNDGDLYPYRDRYEEPIPAGFR